MTQMILALTDGSSIIINAEKIEFENLDAAIGGPVVICADALRKMDYVIDEEGDVRTETDEYVGCVKNFNFSSLVEFAQN